LAGAEQHAKGTLSAMQTTDKQPLANANKSNLHKDRVLPTPKNIGYPPTKRLRAIFSILAFALPAYGYGLEFDIQSIPLANDQKLEFIPFISPADPQPAILVVETPDLDEREKQLQDLDQEPVRTVTVYRQNGSGWDTHLQQPLNSSMDLVDTIQTGDRIGLAGYQDSKLWQLNETTRTFEPVLEIQSMFVGANWDSSPTIEMFYDINDDGRDDFLMPGFDGWHLAIQTEEGFLPPQVVGPPPHMSFEDSARFVGYRARKPYLLDENQDGLEDIAFWINGRFQIYLQESPGQFATEALILDPNQKDVLGDFLSVSLGEDEEGQDETQRMLEGVGDIDGDGLADLIIQTMEGDGIFGLETQYEIHLGQIDNNQRLTFEQQASSIVATGGIQLNNERLDLTGDGREEFVITSVNISLGTIISALITRSASVDVSVYQMHDQIFASEPSLAKEIKVKFDFSTGDLFVPAVLSAEVTGDGRKDLLVQKGLDTLLVFPGEATEKLFAKSPIKLAMSLPSDREGFEVADLNQDGRDELILHLTTDDEANLAVVEFRD
jgi:hypothetical protein